MNVLNFTITKEKYISNMYFYLCRPCGSRFLGNEIEMGPENLNPWPSWL